MCIFFPSLTRRSQYSTTTQGSCHREYKKYRKEIQRDCLNRCVYCDGIEDEIGGEDMMQLDHFRPQQKFPKLVNNPNNLVWSCPKCNQLKSDHWPAKKNHRTHEGNLGFIDPFQEERLLYFSVTKDGTLNALKPPAEFKIQLLLLNRPHMRKIREKRILMNKLLLMISKPGSKIPKRLVKLIQQLSS